MVGFYLIVNYHKPGEFQFYPGHIIWEKQHILHLESYHILDFLLSKI
jgi:hypothetical protein